MVDGMVHKLSQEFPAPPQVIATGGMAEVLATYADSIKTIDPMLTLKGLQLLHEKNIP
jgi:type III pantothenate kinase